jgi:hypothetical protein
VVIKAGAVVIKAGARLAIRARRLQTTEIGIPGSVDISCKFDEQRCQQGLAVRSILV